MTFDDHGATCIDRDIHIHDNKVHGVDWRTHNIIMYTKG